MNDLELLRLAAKAAGLTMCDEWDCAAEGYGILIGTGSGDLVPWNPLDFDGDALRLATSLKMIVDIGCHGRTKVNVQFQGEPMLEVSEPGFSGGDVRRAIVRAAAEIGESLP